MLAQKPAGCNIRAHYSVQESGRANEPRPEFERAVKLARKRNLMIVAEDVTRLLRAKCQYGDPTLLEWHRFWQIVGDVPLATILDPKLTALQLHSEKTKHGMQASEKKVGRPKKKLTRRLFVAILRMRDPETYEPSGIHKINRELRDKGYNVSSRQVSPFWMGGRSSCSTPTFST